MYALIRGTVLMIDGITLTIEVSGIGIGYDVYASPALLSRAEIGGEITASIHHHITDVSESLYGFEDFDERRLFRELNKVNGVGGKTALALLGLGKETLLKSIQLEDDKMLSSVPGIGKKTAQKIIVDLKGSINFAKVSDTPKSPHHNNSNNSLVVSSLVQMGYDKTRVEEIIETLSSDLPLADKVREAIKKLK